MIELTPSIVPEGTTLESPGRRLLLRRALALGGAAALPSVALAEDPFWRQPRVLNLKRAATGELVSATYWKNGNWDLEGYVKLCHVLRDVRANETVQVDRSLLDILFGMTKWLAAKGYSDPLLVTSGFRSKATNSRLEGAAQNSMHLFGRAADITVPGFSIKELSDMGKHFKAGVGLYEKRRFLHVDTGRERFWRGK